MHMDGHENSSTFLQSVLLCGNSNEQRKQSTIYKAFSSRLIAWKHIQNCQGNTYSTAQHCKELEL